MEIAWVHEFFHAFQSEIILLFFSLYKLKTTTLAKISNEIAIVKWVAFVE